MKFDKVMIKAFQFLKEANITHGCKWTIWGALAFYWKTTYGFPIEETKRIGKEIYTKSTQKEKEEWNKEFSFIQNENTKTKS